MKCACLILLTFLSSVALAQSASSKGKFILQGQIRGQNNGFAYLNYINSEGKPQHDSCILNKGSFKFVGKINDPTYARLFLKKASAANSTIIYIEPTFMRAEFELDHFDKGAIYGSKTQKEYLSWLQLKQSDSVLFNFIKKHPQSFVSADILIPETQKLPLDSVKLFYQLLSLPVQKSNSGKIISDFITKAENLLVGKKAPDFTLTDKNGNIVSLKDFTGEYVLIDFWASWCVPCREENPYLKKAFEKYKDKSFVIVGISLDKPEDKNKWLSAIEKDELPWIQLCDFKGWNGEAVNLYNLWGKGIPSNFLINPKGEIIAKDLRGDDVEGTLHKFLE